VTDDSSTRAEEWVFHFMRGNAKAAATVEQSGPPLRPSAVMQAVINLLASQDLLLIPMKPEENQPTKQESTR